MLVARLFFLCCVAGFFLQACAQFPTRENQQIAAKLPARDYFDFTGRGSMAAMIMSGSMGAMGIAIGIAIDEGIAKDLTSSAKAGSFDAKKIVAEYLASQGKNVIWKSEADTSVNDEAPGDGMMLLAIQKLGFRAKGDDIVPWVEIQVGEKLTSYANLVYEPAGHDLQVLRDDHNLAAESLTAALITTLQASFAQTTKSGTSD